MQLELDMAPVTVVPPTFDYGDAPASYGTPSHIINSTLFMGAAPPDDESAAQPSANADADDLAGTDDEDAVNLSNRVFIRGESTDITVAVTGNGLLQGWIDFNGNGTFDAVEQVAIDAPDGDSDGEITVRVAVPESTIIGSTYLRLRWSTAAGLNATSDAANGEVEDHIVDILDVISPKTPLACQAGTGASYATWAGSGNSGTGSFPGSGSFSAVVPGYSYVVSGDVSSVNINTSESFDNPNLFEPIYGSGDNQSNLNPRVFGNNHNTGSVIERSLTTTITFNSPTPAEGFGFIVSDIETEQVTIRAKDANGVDVPAAIVATWFVEAFDPKGSASADLPIWDPMQPALIGGRTGVSTWQTNTLGSLGDDEAPAGWLQPDVSLSELVIEMQPLDSTDSTHSIHIFLASCLNGFDYSDAPVTGTNYGDATHLVTPDIQLGAAIDVDAGSIANADASGDGADDDGVASFPALAVGATSYSMAAVNFNVGSGSGNLYAWIDFDGNGSFDATEFASTLVTDGTINSALNFSGFTAPISEGSTFARFRLTTDTLSSTQSATAASDGEVEDYRLFISIAGVSVSGSVYHDVDHDGSRDSGEDWADSTEVFVNLVDNETGLVVASSPISPGTGNYSFDAVATGNYTLVVTDSETNTVAVPPPGWLPINPTPPSRIISVADQPINNQNFGLFHGSRLTGNVIEDTGVGNGSANDAVQNGAEPGIGNVRVSVTDVAGGVEYATTTTSADGSYTLWLPDDAGSQTVVVRETNANGYISTGGDGGTTGGGYQLANDAVTYLNISGTSYSDIDFFDVPGNTFTPDGEKTTRPGGVVFYGHQFDSGTAGTVNFSFAENNSPASAGWGQSLFIDLNCNGELDNGEPPLAEGGDTAVEADVDLCIVVKVQAPSTAVSGAQQLLTVSANFAYANSSLTDTLTRTDLTRTGEADGAGLVLSKAVDQLQALPGQILTYTVGYKNVSPRNLMNIEVNDSVPGFTTFVDATCPVVLPQALTGCQVATQPAPGGMGPLLWLLDGELAPGAEGAVSFRVKIDE